MINAIDRITANPRIRRGVYIVLGVLIFAVVIMSFVQIWVLYSAPDIAGYGSIQANAQGLPPEDQRGAFVVLNDEHSALYAGNLVGLLATTEPGVVDEKAGAHFLPGEIKHVLIQSAAFSEPADYRVYRVGQTEEEMVYDHPQGTKVMTIAPASGIWQPGAWMVDIPAEGMFGGRTYFQFYVDANK